nr:YceI family protein [Petropleomorpha daqingensis]
MAAGTWTVSDSRTRVTFSVGNLGTQAHGSVACSWGELRLDAEGCPAAVRAEMDLNSLDTGIARRDADLRKPRLLDIDRHPTMVWTAERFTPRDDGSWTAEGVLSVRGTSAPLTVTGAAETDGPWLRVRATGELDRRSVGIRAPSILIGRTVRIEVDAWLTPSLP